MTAKVVRELGSQLDVLQSLTLLCSFRYRRSVSRSHGRESLHPPFEAADEEQGGVCVISPRPLSEVDGRCSSC